MTKRIIISDVDGTLIGNNRKIPSELDRLAELIRERNVRFTIASGRVQSRISELVERLGISLPVIGCNGASCKQGDRYLWNRMIPPCCLKDALILADNLGMSIVMTDSEKEYAFRRTEWIADLMDNYGRYDGVRPIMEDEWPQAKIQKVLIDDSAQSGQIDQVIALLNGYPNEVSVVKYQSGTVDVMPAGCSKGAALAQMARMLGEDLENFVAVGDHQNDIEMIETAGIGAAVANGSDTLKQKANYVCEHPLCTGVIEVVERFGCE